MPRCNQVEDRVANSRVKVATLRVPGEVALQLRDKVLEGYLFAL